MSTAVFISFNVFSIRCRPEMVVGWYHSHPGFGCWLSGVDINTQQGFEALNQRAVAVVGSGGGSNPECQRKGDEQQLYWIKKSLMLLMAVNVLNLNTDFLQALIHGLYRHYYSIAINYRKNELEEKMLLNLHKKKCADGLNLQRFDVHSKTNEQTVQISHLLSYLSMGSY
ncbi:hypothetical protein Drorol1_Dr00006695 [Drosera rotundifolia]